MGKGNQLKKESGLPFRLVIKIASVSFVIGLLLAMALFAEPTQNRNYDQSQKRTDLTLVSHNPQTSSSSKNLDHTKDLNLEFAFKESIRYFERKPKDSKFRFGEEEYTNEEVLRSLENLQMIIRDTPSHQIQNEIKKNFIFFVLSPSDGPPTITGYYEVRIYGKNKPEGEYQYPALSPPKSDLTISENPKLFLREKWSQKSIWEKYSKPIVFLRLTDLHLAQLEGSAVVETETKEKFRINYAADNGQNYISPSVHLEGICPSLKPYHLSNCIQSRPKEVTDAILKNPRYIFFEKESFPKKQLNENSFGPMGSDGIRLVSFRSVAMDKKIPLGLPILLSFQSNKETINDRLVFVHDRGNAITGAGRLDYYLGSGDGVEEMANNLLTKGKVTLLLPKKEKTRNK
ncbi:murein transglycosylase [Leptospira kanakyensis]|uniref:peptidoglycan lytic exotransglycosylase n=1 Tax=Leptospira kanakyensis TaxID=2484968 RepID=A0A6N4PZ33_9LEPT|nr:MltA domain-containing protein [Leptospira kanakyensis]TGK50624.1 murein transglycosylase [Leptospira kanakyensis]TGK63775.1 murein transglycosylase [Leptospira kanakyensis]TGK69762.1 murein transglycosylase [Leptospira kanakyensis]